MATLFLKVTNQSLEASLDIPKLVENSINYLTIHKEYTSDWEGLAIKYLFTYEEEIYEWFNDDVPDYVIKSPGFVVSMVGFTEDDNGIITERITTNPVPVYVYSSGEIDGKTLTDEEVRAKLIESVTSIAQEARIAANDAKEKANNALTTSSSANTTANNASTAASEAKDTANSANTTANEAKEIAVLTKSAHDILSEKANDFANAIKGKKEGSLIVIDDISPIEHNVKVKANGKNLFNCLRAPIQAPKDNVAYISAVTENSITITSKETSTGNGYTHFGSIKIKEFLPQLEVGKTYVLSANSDANIKAIYIPEVSFLWKFNEPLTITDEVLNSGLAMYGYHPKYDGFGDCVISNIQIEEGDTATEYEPYIDPTTVTVTGCGKNLIPFGQGNYIAGTTKTINGVTYTVNEDGSIKVSGTATPANSAFVLYNPTNLKTGVNTVTLSGISQNEKICYLALVNNAKTYYHYGTETYNNTAVDIDINNTRVSFVVLEGKTIDTIIYPQVEFGQTKTEFESPVIYDPATPNANGICDVKSVSPYMQIFTDTPGVTIDCEYNRDTNTIQSDWNENDKNNPTYIKNRTHWKEEFEREHFELPNTERDPRIDLTATGRKVGLVPGQEYTMEAHLINGTVQTMTVVPEEIPAKDALGVEGAVGFILPTGTLIDGLVIDWDKAEVYLGNNAYYKIEEPAISKVVILDVPNVETVYHKIPKEYYDIPTDLEYNENSLNPQSGIAVNEALEEQVKPYLYKNRYLGEYNTTTTEEVGSVTVNSLRVTELERTFAMKCERLYVLVSFPDVANFQNSVPLKVTIKQAQYATTSEICMENILYEGKQKTCLATYEYLRDYKFISFLGEQNGPLKENFSPVGITFSNQVDKTTIEVTITLGHSARIPKDTTIQVWGEVYDI